MSPLTYHVVVLTAEGRRDDIKDAKRFWYASAVSFVFPAPLFPVDIVIIYKKCGNGYFFWKNMRRVMFFVLGRFRRVL